MRSRYRDPAGSVVEGAAVERDLGLCESDELGFCESAQLGRDSVNLFSRAGIHACFPFGGLRGLSEL